MNYLTIEEQKKIADLAEQYIDQAIKNGELFSENLTNWAWDKAAQEIT
mgnify:CR=1 FL=1